MFVRRKGRLQLLAVPTIVEISSSASVPRAPSLPQQALTDDTERANLMDMCLDELQKLVVLDSAWYDTYSIARSVISDYVGQMRH